MDVFLWLIIFSGLLVIGVVLYILLTGGDEDEAVEEKVAEMEDVLNLTDPEVLQ